MRQAAGKLRPRYPRYVLGASLLALTAVATPRGATGLEQQAAQSQLPEAQISASVEVVRLNVAVFAPPGRPLPPLDIEDFKVYDNGVLQDIDLIWRPTDTPLHVALVFDTSQSMRPWWLAVRRAALTFLLKLSDDDCPYVLPFSDTVGPGRWGRYSTNRWTEFLAAVEPGPGTSLHDALVFALYQIDLADEIAAANADAANDSPAERDLEPADSSNNEAAPGHSVDTGSQPPKLTRAMMLRAIKLIVSEMVANERPTRFGNCDMQRKPGDETISAILLLSDGADTTSDASFEDAMMAARLANVPIFPVLLGSAGDDRDLKAGLTQAANETGGLLIADVARDDLPSAYNDVLEYLRSTYVLSYTPSDTTTAGAEEPGSAWHEVRVELRRPLLRTVVRPGYYR